MSIFSYVIWLLAFVAGVVFSFFIPEATLSAGLKFLFVGAWGAVLGLVYHVLCKRTLDAKELEFTQSLNEMNRKLEEMPKPEFEPIVPSVAEESEIAPAATESVIPETERVGFPMGAISASEALDQMAAVESQMAEAESPVHAIELAKPVFPLEDWESFCKDILRNRPFAEVVESLKATLPKLFPNGAGVLYMYGDAQSELQKIFEFGEYPVGGDVLAPADCASFNLGEIVVTDFTSEGASAETKCTHLHMHPQGIHICAPIEGLEEHFGILTIQTDALPEGEDLAFWKGKVSIVAATFGLYVANQNLNVRFRQHSIRDNLTGLFNKRYMEETLYREIFAANRHKTPIGIIMLYPDMINAIREEKGKHGVEQLLWELGQRLPSYIRNEDIPCRYEGDVFCVILPGADYKITRERAEKICNEILQLQIAYGDGVLATTLSLGVSVLPVHAGDVQTLVATASAAMQMAAENGGNQVVMAEALQEKL